MKTKPKITYFIIILIGFLTLGPGNSKIKTILDGKQVKIYSTRMTHLNVSSECLIIMIHQNDSSDFLIRMSHSNV